MGVDQTSLDRIRNATFPASRRGYDKQEVEKFLARLADWLETGGGDESRSETVKRELERVGERTGAILAQAEDSAQGIIGEAEELARETRADADAYSEKARAEADSYSEQTRREADEAAEATRSQADQQARETVADAEAQARRIVDEGTRRRQDIEAVIGDLARRRDEVLDDTEELGERLAAAVKTHRPPAGADPFETPDELDPERRDADLDLEAPGGDDAESEPEADIDADADSSDDENAEAEEQEPAGEDRPAKKPRKTRAAGKRRRGRGVKA